MTSQPAEMRDAEDDDTGGTQSASRVLDGGKGLVSLAAQRGGDVDVARAAADVARPVEEERGGDLTGFIAAPLAEGTLSPLEAARFTFALRCPALTAAWLSPGVGVALTGLTDDFYLPVLDLAGPPFGAPEEGEPSAAMLRGHRESAEALVLSAHRIALSTFTQLVAAGVSREAAQVVLPLSTYTEFRVVLTARDLLDIFRARQVPPAAEPYTRALREIFDERMPLTAAAIEQAALLEQHVSGSSA